MPSQPRLAIAALLSLVGALYLTLLPFEFEFSKVPLDSALANFKGLGFEEGRAKTRQQWFANALMFMPLGFFWAAWLGAASRGSLRLAAVTAAAGLGLVVTASVEFLQSWLPLRTPSLLDMSGNFAGAVAGGVVWL